LLSVLFIVCLVYLVCLWLPLASSGIKRLVYFVFMQAITAAGSGCSAAIAVERYLTLGNLLSEFRQEATTFEKKKDETSTKPKVHFFVGWLWVRRGPFVLSSFLALPFVLTPCHLSILPATCPYSFPMGQLDCFRFVLHYFSHFVLQSIQRFKRSATVMPRCDRKRFGERFGRRPNFTRAALRSKHVVYNCRTFHECEYTYLVRKGGGKKLRNTGFRSTELILKRGVMLYFALVEATRGDLQGGFVSLVILHIL
jgi:hypothetical protein